MNRTTLGEIIDFVVEQAEKRLGEKKIMTQTNDDLINKIVSHIKDEYVLHYTELHDIIVALQSQPFDVMRHLQDGLVAIDDRGRRIRFNGSMVQVRPADEDVWIAADFGNKSLICSCWRPCEDPLAGFSVEWAVDQMENGNCVSCDGCAYNFHWVALPSGMLAEVCENGDQSRVLTQKQFLNVGCKSTWKIFVEPPIEFLETWAREHTGAKVKITDLPPIEPDHGEVRLRLNPARSSSATLQQYLNGCWKDVPFVAAEP